MQGEDRDDRRANPALPLDAVLRSVTTFSRHENGERLNRWLHVGLPYTEQSGIKNT
jgi:hypothetical protein